jgi:hypothetical protein
MITSVPPSIICRTKPRRADGVEVKARDGVVIPSNSLAREDLTPVAERLASGVDGVVTVICKPSGPSANTGAAQSAGA